MKIRFLSVACIELDQAVEFYESQLHGLGRRFFHEIDKTTTRIRYMPEAWPLLGKNTRRCLVNGFPFAIYYVIHENELIVTAIAHLHRNPEHYKKRIM